MVENIRGTVMKEKQVEQNIINSAVKVFIEKGKDGARMQEIADGAGVNKMLLHYYFKDKNSLFLEVIRKVCVDLYGSVIEESTKTSTFREFLSVFIKRHFDFLNEKKDSFQFLLWELSRNRFNLKEILSNSYILDDMNPFEIISTEMQKAISNGEIRPVDKTEFILNLFSLDLFMFLALPAIKGICPMNDLEVEEMIDRRKKEVFRLLWNDIKLD